jgi:hypothetical protein
MNLDSAVIEMPVEEATKAWRDYQAALKRRHHVEDAAIAAGYKALAEGKKLISLSRVITAGGEFDNRLPKLAVAPADKQWCYVDRRIDGSVSFGQVEGWRRRQTTRTVDLPADTLTRCEWGVIERSWSKRAMVPVVPAGLRPARTTTLASYHVLWEVDEWLTAPRPPGDPALLKHLRGDLWIVLATWDLTPLEQAVLAERS